MPVVQITKITEARKKNNGSPLKGAPKSRATISHRIKILRMDIPT